MRAFEKHSRIASLLIALFCLAAWYGAGEAQKGAGKGRPAAKPGAKKVLMVIAPDKFRDEELFEPRKIIEAAGHSVILASTTTAEATGMLGGKAKPDITIARVEVGDFDAVVFVGGSGTRALLNHPGAHELARAAARSGKLVAAICMAPEILANAGLLKGKKAISWSGGHANLKAKGAKLTKKLVVEDGRIITGSGPSAAKAFGNAIVRLLKR
jgi:protease I